VEDTDAWNITLLSQDHAGNINEYMHVLTKYKYSIQKKMSPFRHDIKKLVSFLGQRYLLLEEMADYSGLSNMSHDYFL
jgi:hypothetical protein